MSLARVDQLRHRAADHRKSTVLGSTEMHTMRQRWNALRSIGFPEPNRPMLHLRAQQFAPDAGG
jgi:hypothetical protein